MSNSQAIAAVTSCLQQLVEKAFDTPIPVTTKAPDKAHSDPATRRLNLFLYSIGPNAAWRNLNLPTQRPGGRGRPPLALNLQYLLTVYADDEVDAQKLLGKAVEALSDHPILLSSELRTPGVSSAPNAMFERVHITLQPLTTEELTKLWGAFQSQFRLSVAYEACAALIESRHETPASLPVLQLGTDGRGPVAGASLSRFPFLESVTPTTPRASETVTVIGRNLVKAGFRPSDIQIVLSRMGEEIRRVTDVAIVSKGDRPADLQAGFDAVSFKMPADTPVLAAGPYGVSAHVVTDDELGKRRAYASNEVQISISPRIARITPISVRAGATSVLKVRCEPRPGVGQRVRLLVGVREFAPTAESGAQLTFSVDRLSAGEHTVRLCVDGADSLRVSRRDNKLEFESPDILTVTP